MTRIVDNQRGFALVLALLMLVVMSLIGVMTLNTTDTELKIASNYRRSQLSVSAASSVVTYAQTNGKIYNDIGIGKVELASGDPATKSQYETDIAALGSGTRLREQDEDKNPQPQWNQVQYLATGDLPPGFGSESGSFKARYYLISTTVEELGGAVTRVESQVARLVPAVE